MTRHRTFTAAAIVCALLALACAQPLARAQEQPKRPKVGVVLAGGGARGAAHIGVLKVLEEYDIPVDLVVGTSMGSIIGGLYAIGYTANEIDSLISNQDWDVVMSDKRVRSSKFFEDKKFDSKYVARIPFSFDPFTRKVDVDPERDTLIGPLPVAEAASPKSFLDNIPIAYVGGQNIYNLFTSLSVGYLDSLDFDNMPIPFACVAVDVVKHEEVIWRSGSFVDAIRSSMAIPGYFAPVESEGRVLVDGGALNNYPVDVARKMGADIVVGVKFGSSEGLTDSDVHNIGDMLGSFFAMYTREKDKAAIENTDIFINPNTAGYGVLDFSKESIATLIRNGYDAAMEKSSDFIKLRNYLDNCEKEMENNLIGPVYVRKKYDKAVHLDRDSITLGAICCNGIDSEAAEYMLKKSVLKEGVRVKGSDITDEINRFYNTGIFKSVTFSLKGHEEPYDMDINFVPGMNAVLGLGFRIDAEEVSVIQLDVSLNQNTMAKHAMSLFGRIAINPAVGFKYTYTPAGHLCFNAEAGYKYSNTNGLNTNADHSFALNNFSLRANVASRHLKNGLVEGGIEYENFRYSHLNPSMDCFDYDKNQKRRNFLNSYVKWGLDTRDDEFFPTRGILANGSLRAYLGDQSSNGFSAASLFVSGVAGMIDKLAFTPSLYFRSVSGKQVPLAYMNFVGGELRGRYMTQQIPFCGFNFGYPFDKKVGVLAMKGRYNVSGNHYATATIGAIKDGPTIGGMLAGTLNVGAQIGYIYRSKFGPLAADLQWSNYTNRLEFYISLGYDF